MYLITHKETGEQKLVIPRGFGGDLDGDGIEDVLFVDANLAGNLPEYFGASVEKGNAYHFENAKGGVETLTSDIYTIEVAGEKGE